MRVMIPSCPPETLDETLGLDDSRLLFADNKGVVSHLGCLFALAAKMLIPYIYAEL